MCQSRAQGGRRCLKGVSGSFNPADRRVSVQPMEFLSPQGGLKALAAVARHKDAVLSTESAELLAQLDSFETLPREERWELWESVANARYPGSALRAMFASGFDKQIPELYDVKDVVQDASWHPEGNVGEHLAQSADEAARRLIKEPNSERRAVLVFAAMLHDIGKTTTTEVQEDGRVTSRGHDAEGAPLAARVMERFGASEEIQRQVAMLVKTHMRHTAQPSDRAVRKLNRQLQEVGLTVDDWAYLADADCCGRGDASIHGVGISWRSVYERLRASNRL